MSYIFRGIQLPAHLKESIDAYVETGRPVGSFVEACITNNLARAIMYADEESIKALPAIVGYIYNECPGSCWGNSDRYAGWIARKRTEREKSHAG